MTNNKKVFSTIGASNHSTHERQKDDYYATDPKCAIDLLNLLPDLADQIWEPACGEGHLSKAFESAGKVVYSTDLIDRGYGLGGYDFLFYNNLIWNGDIITNPPYKLAQEFIEQSLKAIHKGRYVCMFLKLTFLESKERKKLFLDYPPKFVYVYSTRQKCAINGDFENTGSSAIAYAWYIWQKGFQGETILKWI